MNINTEKRSNIRRFGKIALIGLIFGAALALMFALTALAEDTSETTETTETTVTTVPDITTTTEPDVTTTTVPDTTTTTVPDTTTATVPDTTEATVPESEPAEESADVSSEVPAGPVVTTDKTYYNPGEQVNVTGSGFQPGEDVSISFVDLNGVAETNQTITADESGSITFSYNILGSASYQVIATGIVSGTSALASFEDPAVKVTLEGWDLTPNEKWSKGQISGYVEGESIPFKLEIEGLSTGLKTVTINHDYNNGSAIGIDYLTDYPDSAPYDPATNPNPNAPFVGTEDWLSPFTVLGDVLGISQTVTISGNYLIGTISFTVNNVSDIYITWGAHLSDEAADWPGASLQVRFDKITSDDVIVAQGDRTVPIAVQEAGAPAPTEGTISGFKFEDVNGNGVWDDGEPALEGWIINVTGPNSYSSSDSTDNSGYYEFTGLLAGTYSLSEVLKDGWVLTVSPIDVVISEGTNDYEDNNFGNFKYAKICGYKFNDLNGDGIWDSGEPGLPGWTITLTGTDSLNRSLNLSTTTNVDGRYCFEGLWASDSAGYTIAEVLQADWSQTTLPIEYVQVVTSGFGSWWNCDGEENANGATAFSAVPVFDFGNIYTPPTGGGPGGGPTPSLVIAGITEVAGAIKVAGALKVAGITELPFTGSNLVLVYLIAILMIISGTAILASSRKIKVNRARL
jgi:hypothetical protein